MIYDNIGGIFGNARPATGFSADLLNLHQLTNAAQEPALGILAPHSEDPVLNQEIQRLRMGGQRVVVDLTDGKSKPADQQCNKILTQQDNRWIIKDFFESRWLFNNTAINFAIGYPF